jgi:hypothetical protein
LGGQPARREDVVASYSDSDADARAHAEA